MSRLKKSPVLGAIKYIVFCNLVSKNPIFTVRLIYYSGQDRKIGPPDQPRLVPMVEREAECEATYAYEDVRQFPNSSEDDIPS